MKIEYNDSPYEFDTDENGFPTFTKKNIVFLDAILRYDSNYSTSSDKNNAEYQNSYAGILEKDDFFDFAASEDPEKKDELGNPVDDLYRVIVSIDKINSTHLASEGKKSEGQSEKNNKGRAKVAAAIRAIGGQELKKRLEQGDASLISEIASERVGGKHNFSFATKFCAYVSIHALKQDRFCIYDKVVQSVLPYYGYMYIDDFCRRYGDLYKTVKGSRNDSLADCYKNQDNYGAYRALIDEIISGVSKKVGERITYADFDHMVWYYFKGSESKVQEAMNKLPRKDRNGV